MNLQPKAHSEATFVLDENVASLQRSIGSTETGEVVQIQLAPLGDWFLTVSDKGRAYVGTDVEHVGKSVRMIDIFSTHVYEDVKGIEYIVEPKTQSCIRRSEFFGEASSGTVPLSVGVNAIVADLDVYAFTTKFSGCRYWWGIGTLFQVFNFNQQGGKVADWWNKHAPAWARQVHMYVPGNTHIRKAKVIEKSKRRSTGSIATPSRGAEDQKEGTDGETQWDVHRSLDEASWSTTALLVLPTRWVFLRLNAGGLEPQRLPAVECALNALLSLLPDEFSVTLFPEMQHMWQAPLGPSGINGVLVPMRGAVADARPLSAALRALVEKLHPPKPEGVGRQRRLSASKPPAARAYVEKAATALADEFGEGLESAPVLRLLKVFLLIDNPHPPGKGEVRDPTANLFGQLIWQLSAKIEDALEDIFEAKDRFGDSADGRRKKIIAYWGASRNLVEGRAHHASSAIDASRVGGRALLLSAMALPDNTCIPLFPQVRASIYCMEAFCLLHGSLLSIASGSGQASQTHHAPPIPSHPAWPAPGPRQPSPASPFIDRQSHVDDMIWYAYVIRGPLHI